MKRMTPRPRGQAATRPAPASLSATAAQNNFGLALSQAKRGTPVFITRYNRPEAVLLSIEAYEALTGQDAVDLRDLERQFDAMLERMQHPAQRRAADRLFRMSGSELGKAALGGT